MPPSPSRRVPAWWGLLGLGLVVIFGLGLLTLSRGGLSDPSAGQTLGRFGEVPAFALIDRSGEAVGKTDLLGQIWVVQFIFTQCVEACPLSSHLMMQLQKTFSTAADIRLVSITVDPEHDTPAVLAAYATRLEAHPERWLFLTGDKKHIYWLAQEGFRLGVYDVRDAQQTSAGQPVAPIGRVAAGLRRVLAPAVALAHHPQTPQGDAAEAIQHSDRFVLVDRQGHIRQYYSSQDKDVLQRLERDVTRLRAES